MRLLQQAAEYQQQARRVTRTLKLRERWEKIGDVTFSGSSAFGLMVQPNIDVEVYTDSPVRGQGSGLSLSSPRCPGSAG